MDFEISNGLLFVLVVGGIFAIATAIAAMKVFAKAGQPAVTALIPLLNAFFFLRVIRKPAWWFLGFLLPAAAVGLVMMGPDPEVQIYVYAGIGLLAVIWIIFVEQIGLALARVFGKDDSFAAGVIFFPYIYYPILGFGKAEYQAEVPPNQERTYLGKVFVLGYGVAALGCLMTAVAVYTQQMGFVLPKGETPKGAATRVDQAIAETKKLQVTNNRALTRWVEEADEVVRLEAEQSLRREFYRAQIEVVRPPKDNMGKQEPIIELVRDAATGMLKMNPSPNERKTIKVGRLRNADAQPQSFYEAGLMAAEKESKDLLAEARKDDLAAEEAGLKINGNNMVKGLRTRTDEQNQIAVDADAEAIYLEDFITNRRADAQLFVKRRDALQASIERLRKFMEKKADAAGN